ncbi:MAG: PEP-CTERM system histidine kinase PrsK, partial [Desulfomicrobium sp.]|nr:PEP-CTERM system histidine kinase PrsK [Desulfomicrobium sp.]
MTTPILATLMTLAAICVALGFAGRMALGVLRGERSRASAALALGLVLTAALEALDLAALLDPEGVATWRLAALLVEGALGPAWVVFTASFARDYEEGGLPWTQRVLIGLSALMLPWAAYLAAQGAYYAPDFATEQLL